MFQILPRDACGDWDRMLTREVRIKDGSRLPRIYCFVNGGEDGWWNMVALSEDGEFLAGHVCSHPSFGPHDMGLVGEWKHDRYNERYPDGFELVWWPGKPGDNADIMAAHQRHLDAGEAGTPWQRERKQQKAGADA